MSRLSGPVDIAQKSVTERGKTSNVQALSGGCNGQHAACKHAADEFNLVETLPVCQSVDISIRETSAGHNTCNQGAVFVHGKRNHGDILYTLMRRNKLDASVVAETLA